ncbi:dihydrolipoyl dehydrogenase [Microbacterium karelineae]|uniref:dihydrolipoyl dehydrogenase n=1 Tax=Microbacterium karelineae TaxID=2654283 RepID=UPI0012EA5745|nr:dihydrolipoyl dehydrogenase [Microbacterium karelineae]
MSSHSFDLVVLGGGSAGYAAALRAAELGRSVALVEQDRLGGTCLHRGCVPTKALLHTAEVADGVRHAAAVGVRASLDGIDAAAARAWREKVVAGKHRGLTSLIRSRGITVVDGRGTLTSSAERPAVAVGDDLFVADDVVVATGAVSRSIPGLALGGRILDSEAALALDEVPERAIVLGGGVIGVEFASAWRSLGAEVTIVEALDHLIANEDPSSRAALEKAYRRRGITLELGARVSEVSAGADSVSLTFERDGSSSTLDADVVLAAVGRAPVTDGLGLEAAGARTERGFVVVDEALRTTAPHVWAVGDIVAGPQLAHRGFRHGIFVAETIAGEAPSPLDDALFPRVTYSSPEVASVGLTEPQAIAAHGAERVVAREVPLAGNAKSEIVSAGSPVRGGFAKVVALDGGPILGVHLVGDRVGELITEGQLAVAWEARADDLAPLIHAHPTQSEALGEAFLALAGSPLHTT